MKLRKFVIASIYVCLIFACFQAKADEGFDFVGVPGSYVERHEKSGDKFNIDLIFQGEDHIDNANSFLLSAENKNPWKIIHPIYDNLFVQPLALEIENSDYNSTQITGGIWETLSDTFPEQTIDQVAVVVDKNAEIITQNVDVFSANQDLDPDVDVINAADVSSKSIYDSYLKLTDNDDDIVILKDLFRKASAGVSVILSDPNYYMTQTLNLINYPFIIKQNIQFKINKLIENYSSIKSLFINDGAFFQSYASTLLSVSCACAVTPDATSYESKSEVLNVIEQIDSLYYDIIDTFDAIDFVQNSDIALGLDSMFTSAVSSLYLIAFEAQQERTIMLDKDDNMINIAAKYYGTGDEDLESFINHNAITLNEHLQIKKGRKITYYV